MTDRVHVPRFSIITPVHDPPLPLLRGCLASVAGQSFADWELCLVDDGSTDPAVLDELRRIAGTEGRVKLVERSSAGGIVVASNTGLAMATGEFVVLLDHDDRLDDRALELLDAALRSDHEIDYVYTDEDKLGADGLLHDPFYKPDWSPERLRSQNYCTHLSVLRRRIVAEVGGFHEGFDGSQDHDLILRVTERSRRVHHIPEILYHWCITPGSAAGDSAAKPYAREAGRRAVAEQMSRLGIPATVEHLRIPGTYRVRRAPAVPAPIVSVVIATAGRSGPVWGVERPFVVGAAQSVIAGTDFPRVEVVVVADGATPPDVLAELRGLDVRLVGGEGPFDVPAFAQQGVLASAGEYVVLLDEATVVEQPDWLEVLLGFFRESDVGVVGARLLAPDGTLAHGGFLLNARPLPIFRGFAGDDPGVFGLLDVDREVSAVSDACLVTSREVFDELGGLRAKLGPDHGVDYCLRVRKSGRRIIWTPHATLYDLDRARPVTTDDAARLQERWGEELKHDPYGNPHFAPGRADWCPDEKIGVVAGLRGAWRRLRFVGGP